MYGRLHAAGCVSSSRAAACGARRRLRNTRAAAPCRPRRATDGTRAAAIEGVDPISAVFGVEHRADFGTFTVDVDVLKYAVEATAVASYNGVLVGATGKVARGKEGSFGVDDYGALIGYKKGDITFAVQGEKKFESFFVAYHQVRRAEGGARALSRPLNHGPPRTCTRRSSPQC